MHIDNEDAHNTSLWALNYLTNTKDDEFLAFMADSEIA
jgi:hypothetical protein